VGFVPEEDIVQAGVGQVFGDAGQQPDLHPGDAGLLVGGLPLACHEPLHIAVAEGGEELVLAGEVQVEGAFGDSRADDHVIDLEGVHAMGQDERLCGVEQVAATLLAGFGPGQPASFRLLPTLVDAPNYLL
jgi:hypothetical protein